MICTSGDPCGTWHQPTQQLVITASVEANGYGDVIGSFLTFAPQSELISQKHLDLTQHALRIQHQDKPLISKVESVAITDYSNNIISGVFAADNDDGSSQFMTFSLKLHN